MKTILSMSLILFMIHAASAMDGLYKNDTIRFKFDKMLIEVASINFINKSPEKTNMDKRIKQVQKVLSEMSIKKPADGEMITITFCEMDEDIWAWNYKEITLSYEDKSSKNLIIVEDGTIFEKEFGRYCLYFSYLGMEMKIFVDDLADLDLFLTETFKKKTEQATNYIKDRIGDKHKRKQVLAVVDLRGDEVLGYILDRGNKPTDILILSVGIGSGLIKNSFVSEINLRLGFSYNFNEMLKNTFAIDWSIMYDFSQPGNNKYYNLNHFVSFNWDHNFSSTPEDEIWYGFSIGYLVKQNGDFFKKNTFRLSVNKKINDSFSIYPELYFNGFFKNGYPGIRLNVNF